ncbi:MAG: MlaD family protein [Verrucomicrobiota bacterium]
MSKRANPVTIGIFVVSAFILLIGTLSFLGASKLIRESPRFVLFFEESVNGLDVGARVKFKGVPIGTVEEILIRLPSQLTESAGIPVIIGLDDELIVNDLGAPFFVDDAEVLAAEVRQGLRARLNTESLITGLLFVELNYEDNPPPALYHQDIPELLEIPTIPSQLQEITRNATEAIVKIGDIDFAELGRNLNRLVATVNMRVRDIDTRQLSKRLVSILTELEAIIDSDKIGDVVENLDATIVSIQSVSDSLNDALPVLMADVNQAVASLEETFNKASQTLDTVNEVVSPNSDLYQDLEATIVEAQSTLRAIKDLAVFIENNPNALISGRSLE